MERAPGVLNPYYEKTAELPPHDSLVYAVQMVTDRDAALDVGSGGLRDTRYLLDMGFSQVVALDQQPAVAHLVAALQNPRATALITSLEQYTPQRESFNIINAQYTLPFVQPEHFEPVFSKLTHALTDQGVIVGQCFGRNDEWRGSPGMTFCTQDELHAALAQLEILNIAEKEYDEATALGDPKHWHVLEFMARK